jgi:hypothetical protein
MGKIEQFFEDLFAIFGLGVSKNSSRSLAFIIWVLNILLPLAIISDHVSEKGIFVSYDALSRITDIIQLFQPIFVHLTSISIDLCNYGLYMKIHQTREKVENLLGNFQNEKMFKEIEKRKIKGFLVKFFIVEIVNLGIEAFLIIT